MRTRYRIERRALLTGGTALVLSAVAGARVPLAQTLEKLSFQTNWRAQAEHGSVAKVCIRSADICPQLASCIQLRITPLPSRACIVSVATARG